MSSSAYRTPSWDDEDFEMLGQEPLGTSSPAHDTVVFQSDVIADAGFNHEFVEHRDTATHQATWTTQDDDVLSQESSPATEYTAMPGLPGRGAIVVTALVAGGCAALDFALTGHLSIFFDLCFVVIGLVSAMAVRRHDLFTAGVLPPIVFAAVIATVAIAAPATLAPDGGLSKAFMTGLAGHAAALVTGYGVALLTIGGRVLSTRQR
ncbi:MAG: DUF6542 domain-containing protein [Nocardioidaceae bacterium]